MLGFSSQSLEFGLIRDLWSAAMFSFDGIQLAVREMSLFRRNCHMRFEIVFRFGHLVLPIFTRYDRAVVLSERRPTALPWRMSEN